MSMDGMFLCLDRKCEKCEHYHCYECNKPFKKIRVENHIKTHLKKNMGGQFDQINSCINLTDETEEDCQSRSKNRKIERVRYLRSLIIVPCYCPRRMR